MPQPHERDLEKTRADLAAWLPSRLPGASNLEVRSLGGPENTGFSSDSGVSMRGHCSCLLVTEIDRPNAHVFGIVDDLVVRTPHQKEEVFNAFFFQRAGNQVTAVDFHLCA